MILEPPEPDVIAAAFLDACRAELAALKPGNVHVHAAGHGMEVHQFEASAEAATPIVADETLPVGARIRRAVEASLAAAGCNTNLGVLLLCVPLAKAAALPVAASGLHPRLFAVLAALTRADAAEVYRAIALANPGGLGAVDEEDVAGPPSVPLREAMALAADRDRIARAYMTGFEDLFDVALPRLRAARGHAPDANYAVTTLHMALLAAFPDSHIARKRGEAVARKVQRMAIRLAPFWNPMASPSSFDRILAFDADLKAEGLNPGTTADLVVATLFAEALTKLLEPPPHV